jgi:hypothetical protein
MNTNCTISKKKNSHNEWTMKFTGMTEGMILSILNGMQYYVGESGSPVGNDVHQFVKYAYEDEKKSLGEPFQTV